jgi:hypothetical protein
MSKPEWRLTDDLRDAILECDKSYWWPNPTDAPIGSPEWVADVDLAGAFVEAHEAHAAAMLKVGSVTYAVVQERGNPRLAVVFTPRLDRSNHNHVVCDA